MSWSYDSFGNRKSESFGGSTGESLPPSTAAQYNANNQVTGGSLGYDAAGNVTADNANYYLYDGEGRVCAVQDRTFGGMTEYIYDAEGTRVAKGTIYELERWLRHHAERLRSQQHLHHRTVGRAVD